MKKRWTVYVTEPIPRSGIDLLKKTSRVVVRNKRQRISRTELHAAARTADVLITMVGDRVDAALLDHAPRLKMVANYLVGFDNIDLVAATARGVVCTNNPGVLDEAVAEHAIALTLAVSRRVVEGDAFMRAGKYTHWMPLGFLGPSLAGKTIGIVGMGRIGATVARIAKNGFGMKVLYTDVGRNTPVEKELGATYLSLTAVLRAADVVSVHVPLLPSTHHLIDTPQLRLMKKTAILINTSRGPVVSERALKQALARQQIFGAGIDVFECEPHLDCSPTPQSFANMANVVVTPHIASATTEAREAMSLMTARGIIEMIHGKKPRTLLNPAAWNVRRT